MKNIFTSSKRQIKLGCHDIIYTLRVNRRSRNLRLVVYGDGSLTVTQPRFVPFNTVENYLREKADWIISKIDYQKQNSINIKPVSRRQYLADKERARDFVRNKIDYYNQTYRYSVNRISIRNQKTRWGSCSKKGNLNFNYKIIFLPEDLADLIIVHELCHLREFNHSTNFWRLVSIAVPNYKNLRRELKAKNIMIVA